MVQPDLRGLSEDVNRIAESGGHSLIDGFAVQRHAEHAGEHHRHGGLTRLSLTATEFAHQFHAVHGGVCQALPEPRLCAGHDLPRAFTVSQLEIDQ